VYTSGYDMQFDGFDWDEGNWPKCAKHGVSKAEIESVFEFDPGIYLDPDHSSLEQRFRAIGMTEEGRMVLIAFTMRTMGSITKLRPVSARYMHKKEVTRYDIDT
jgi:uncharacterized protein